MSELEKEIQRQLQNENIPISDPKVVWSRIQENRWQRKGKTDVYVFRRLAVSVIALFSLAVIGTLYGNTIVTAASSLFHEVFGTIEEVKTVDPHSKQEDAEEQFEIAKKVLSDEEYTRYTSLIKEQMQIMKKAIEIVDGAQIIHMDRLNDEEKAALKRNEQELRPLINKIDQHFDYTIKAAANMLPFPVTHPTYIPAGYMLEREEAKASGTTGKPNPIVSYSYKQKDGEFGFIIRQSVILSGEEDEYARRVPAWEKEESYVLKGNKVMYATEGKNVTMMKMIVPEKETSPSYQIFIIADVLSKQDMEKIVLSML